MTLTKGRLLACVVGGALFTTAAGLGIGLKHPDGPPAAPDPVALEANRLVANGAGTVSQAWADCLARVLVDLGADTPHWDGLAPTERAFVQTKTQQACPRSNFGQ